MGRTIFSRLQKGHKSTLYECNGMNICVHEKRNDEPLKAKLKIIKQVKAKGHRIAIIASDDSAK